MCWELGFDYGYAYDSAYYGEGEGDILLDDVYCDGWEWSLDECSFETTHNCGHYEDVGIECYGKIGLDLFNHFLYQKNPCTFNACYPKIKVKSILMQTPSFSDYDDYDWYYWYYWYAFFFFDIFET